MSSNLRSIENFSLSAIKICLSGIEYVTLVSGINLVPEKQYYRLIKHPAYMSKVEKGFLREITLNTEEIKHDDRTNLPYVEKKGEQVAVSNVLINGEAKPVLKNGVKFTVGKLLEVGVSSAVANRVVRFTPSEGWQDYEHLIEAIEVDEPNDKNNIRKLF